MSDVTMQQLNEKRALLDSGNMWEAIATFPRQLTDAREIPLPPSHSIRTDRVQNIVFSGMGGSAIGGDLLNTFFRNELPVPLVVNRNYQLPGFVNERSLLVFSSYSGNTEETLSAFQQGLETGAQIAGISSGGELAEHFEHKGFPWIQIPRGYQPRAALGYSFIPLARFFVHIGLVKHFLEDEIAETISVLQDLGEQYQSDGVGNRALEISRTLVGSLPVTYTAPELSVVGVRFKGQIAENAQMLGFSNELPEMNHNEIVGWDQQEELLRKIVLLWMVDRDSDPKIQRRLEITRDLLQEYPKEIFTLETTGGSWMARLFSLIHLSDWVSLHTALLNGVDPTPVKRIDLLKERLAG